MKTQREESGLHNQDKYPDLQLCFGTGGDLRDVRYAQLDIPAWIKGRIFRDRLCYSDRQIS